MRTVTVFENAKEFIDALESLPKDVWIVFDAADRSVRLTGEGSEKFGIENVTHKDVIRELFKRICDIKVVFE